MDYLPFQICVPLAFVLGIVYFVFFLLSLVSGKGKKSIAWRIISSSLNIGFGVDLLLLVTNAWRGTTPELVQGYGAALTLGGFAMLLNAGRDLAQLFGLRVHVMGLRALLSRRRLLPFFCCA